MIGAMGLPIPMRCSQRLLTCCGRLILYPVPNARRNRPREGVDLEMQMGASELVTSATRKPKVDGGPEVWDAGENPVWISIRRQHFGHLAFA
jgi:hypothetical protein